MTNIRILLLEDYFTSQLLIHKLNTLFILQFYLMFTHFVFFTLMFITSINVIRMLAAYTWHVFALDFF